mgnify:CR=1 FL=1
MPGMQNLPTPAPTGPRSIAIQRTALLVIAGLAAVAAIARPDASDAAFECGAGLRLPPGVHVVGHQRTMHDNLLHVGDRWWLSGPPRALMTLVDGTGFAVSTEDAKWVLPARDGRGKRWTPDDVRLGFEQETPRNDWYLILGDGSTALYEDN